MISKSACRTFTAPGTKATAMLSLPYLAMEDSLPGRVSKNGK